MRSKMKKRREPRSNITAWSAALLRLHGIHGSRKYTEYATTMTADLKLRNRPLTERGTMGMCLCVREDVLLMLASMVSTYLLINAALCASMGKRPTPGVSLSEWFSRTAAVGNGLT